MKKITSLGPLEQEILNCVWHHHDEQAVSVRRIFNCLRNKKSVAYTTVMTIMNRLTDKGLLTRKKQGRAFVYSSKISPKQAIKSLVHHVFQPLVNQFGQEAVVAFANELNQLSDEEKQFFIQELKKPNQGQTKSKR